MSSKPSQIDHVAAFISSVGEDLARGTKEEQEVGRILDAVQVALQIHKTGELAALVEPWIDGTLNVMARREL